MMQIKKLTLTHKKDLRVILEDFQLVRMTVIRPLSLERRETENRRC